MDGTNRTYLIGELATATGLTVRTLQHYDNIGLLPTAGRTEGGRRYYTEEDILCLERIIFYKSLGLTLQEIRDNLVQRPELSQIEQILQEQEMALYKKIEDAHASIAAIKAYRTALAAGNKSSWRVLTSFIRILKKSNLMDWRQYTFDDNQKEILGKRFSKEQSAFDLYHTWRILSLKAMMLVQSGAAPDGPAAQDMAKDWWEMMQEATGGDDEQCQAFAQVQGDLASWPEGDRNLMDSSQAFIQRAMKHFLSSQSLSKNGGALKNET